MSAAHQRARRARWAQRTLRRPTEAVGARPMHRRGAFCCSTKQPARNASSSASPGADFGDLDDPGDPPDQALDLPPDLASPARHPERLASLSVDGCGSSRLREGFPTLGPGRLVMPPATMPRVIHRDHTGRRLLGGDERPAVRPLPPTRTTCVYGVQLSWVGGNETSVSLHCTPTHTFTVRGAPGMSNKISSFAATRFVVRRIATLRG